MARIMEEQELRNNRNRCEGYMVAVEADTYEEARALAYQHYDAHKEEKAREARQRIREYWQQIYEDLSAWGDTEDEEEDMSLPEDDAWLHLDDEEVREW